MYYLIKTEGEQRKLKILKAIQYHAVFLIELLTLPHAIFQTGATHHKFFQQKFLHLTTGALPWEKVSHILLHTSRSQEQSQDGSREWKISDTLRLSLCVLVNVDFHYKQWDFLALPKIFYLWRQI